MLITDVLFDSVATAAVSAGAGAMFLVLWYLMPLERRLRLARGR
jgi:hypothetical protein